jgi:hypothetical protein
MNRFQVDADTATPFVRRRARLNACTPAVQLLKESVEVQVYGLTPAVY